MKCDDVQLLQGPYLDSELDARTTLEVEQHLKGCADCARLFAEEQKLEARIQAGLRHGCKTTALWDPIERSVAAAAAPAARPHDHRGPAQPGLWHGFLSTLGGRLQAGWRRLACAWAGLAAAWLVILVLHLSAREVEPRLVPDKRLPPAAEVRFAVTQKRLLLAELPFPSEPTPANREKATPPTPHSERRKQTLNT